MGGGNMTLQSSPSDYQGGINIDGQLRQAGYLMDQNIITPIHGSEYWVEQMRQIEIDKKIKKSFNRQWCHDFNDA